MPPTSRVGGDYEEGIRKDEEGRSRRRHHKHGMNGRHSGRGGCARGVMQRYGGRDGRCSRRRNNGRASRRQHRFIAVHRHNERTAEMESGHHATLDTPTIIVRRRLVRGGVGATAGQFRGHLRCCRAPLVLYRARQHNELNSTRRLNSVRVVSTGDAGAAAGKQHAAAAKPVLGSRTSPWTGQVRTSGAHHIATDDGDGAQPGGGRRRARAPPMFYLGPPTSQAPTASSTTIGSAIS